MCMLFDFLSCWRKELKSVVLYLCDKRKHKSMNCLKSGWSIKEKGDPVPIIKSTRFFWRNFSSVLFKETLGFFVRCFVIKLLLFLRHLSKCLFKLDVPWFLFLDSSSSVEWVMYGVWHSWQMIRCVKMSPSLNLIFWKYCHYLEEVYRRFQYKIIRSEYL